MNPINISFSEKEQALIALVAPPLTAEEVCNKVLHDWFANIVVQMRTAIKSQSQAIDDIIADNAAKVATEQPTPVVDAPVV